MVVWSAVDKILRPPGGMERSHFRTRRGLLTRSPVPIMNAASEMPGVSPGLNDTMSVLFVIGSAFPIYLHDTVCTSSAQDTGRKNSIHLQAPAFQAITPEGVFGPVAFAASTHSIEMFATGKNVGCGRVSLALVR